MARYNIVLGVRLDRDLGALAKRLDVTKSEVLRRALVLFKHAVEAKKVTLIAPNGTKQAVLLK